MTINHYFTQCPFRFPNGNQCAAMISVEHLINHQAPACGSCGRAFTEQEMHALREAFEKGRAP